MGGQGVDGLMPPQMFLRTALTENRIEKLEQQMALVIRHLKLEDAEVEQKTEDETWEASAPVRDMSDAPSPQPSPTHSSGAAKDRRRRT